MKNREEAEGGVGGGINSMLGLSKETYEKKSPSNTGLAGPGYPRSI